MSTSSVDDPVRNRGYRLSAVSEAERCHARQDDGHTDLSMRLDNWSHGIELKDVSMSNDLGTVIVLG